MLRQIQGFYLPKYYFFIQQIMRPFALAADGTDPRDVAQQELRQYLIQVTTVFLVDYEYT